MMSAVGRSLVIGVELVEERERKAPANADVEAAFYCALDRGLSFKVAMGNVLTLTLPLIISEDDRDCGLDILEACIGEEG